MNLTTVLGTYQVASKWWYVRISLSSNSEGKMLTTDIEIHPSDLNFYPALRVINILYCCHFNEEQMIPYTGRATQSSVASLTSLNKTEGCALPRSRAVPGHRSCSSSPWSLSSLPCKSSPWDPQKDLPEERSLLRFCRAYWFIVTKSYWDWAYIDSIKSDASGIQWWFSNKKLLEESTKNYSWDHRLYECFS